MNGAFLNNLQFIIGTVKRFRWPPSGIKRPNLNDLIIFLDSRFCFLSSAQGQVVGFENLYNIIIIAPEKTYLAKYLGTDFGGGGGGGAQKNYKIT